MDQITAAQRIELAQALGINEQFLYQCLSGRRAMNPKQAVSVELATEGRLSRRMVRPNDWHLIWPELVTDEHPAPIPAEQA